MLASEQFQQVVVPRLNTETDPGYTKLAKKSCFPRRNAARVRFNRPFLQCGKIKSLMKTAEQEFELRNVQRRWCTAADIDCRRKKTARPAVAPYQFTQDGLAKARR